MPAKSPRKDDLEPIETASRDELAALQLARLQWSLRHAYVNVPHYRKAFDAQGASRFGRIDQRVVAAGGAA